MGRKGQFLLILVVFKVFERFIGVQSSFQGHLELFFLGFLAIIECFKGLLESIELF